MKDALTQEGLISLIKQRDRGMTVLGLLVRGGMKREQALTTTVGIQVATPEGIENRDYRISELLDEARVLDDLQAHCEECMAGRGEAFGCLKCIHYPISGKAEEWLVELSKNALVKGQPHAAALQYVHNSGITGDQFRRMRADATGSFLELKKPLQVTIAKSLLNKKTVYTDQLLYLLLGSGKIQDPRQMAMLLLFAGALTVTGRQPDEGSCEMAVNITGDDGKDSWRAFNLPECEEDDQSVKELKEFFRTMFVAYVLDRGMTVEL